MGILGIDFGLARTGIAYSEGELAEPIGVYTAKSKAERRKLLKSLLSRYNVKQIVIGYTPSTIAGPRNQFISDLKRLTQVPIYLVEESMTTVQAHDILKVRSKKKRSGNVDAVAAAVILQSYLDERTKTHS